MRVSLKGWMYNRKWQFFKAVILLWALKLVKVSKAHLGGSHLFDDEILKKGHCQNCGVKLYLNCISRLKFYKYVCLCVYKHMHRDLLLKQCLQNGLTVTLEALW